MAIERVSRPLSNSDFIIETGKWAKQAHGAVTVQHGGTVVMATAVSEREVDPEKDFFPLTVDYREKLYAAGKIPGGYFKREGRPTEKETLTSRLIDRPIRSAFGKDYYNETQILVNVLSFDGENDPDVLAINAASAALIVSDVPFTDPISAVRVGLIGGQLVINPPMGDMEQSDLDLVVAGNKQKIIMIEAGANEVPEEQMIKALKFGHDEIKKLCDLQSELGKKVNKPKREFVKPQVCDEVKKKVAAIASHQAFKQAFSAGSKEGREAAVQSLYKDKVLAQLKPAGEEEFDEKPVKTAFEKLEKEYVRDVLILGEGKRVDGRGAYDIREVTCDVGVLPRTHGSAVFTRGQTQALCVTTLGTGDDEQRIEALEGEVKKRFMLHYNFPPSSVGETGRTGGTGRREIGHGALAERALKPVVPTSEDFPYVVRLVSDILESNGSSSMATVCGGTLALMDAGVPLKAPVAGMAIGLITDEKRFKVLTDIAGIEDHLGDMDFKAAGTAKGLTALQMDLKIAGISEEIMLEAFDHAKKARFKILDIIAQTIKQPRTEISEFAPRITTIQINPEKIGALIGPGGKVIRGICDETGAKVEIDDSGLVMIASTEAKAAELAAQRVREITAEAEVGAIYQGTVRKLMAFGAFCEILPGQDGLCHVSEVADGFVKDVTEYLRVGDVVPVKVVGVENGKISLSIKQAKEGGWPKLPEGAERDTISPPSERSRGGGRDRSRSRR
ncbi:MAG TPA: polyribonucleotide nucleotidyltransferase [Verrucomicrobiae bacterium]|jgi:polyribonucleotide nucleotidyltransferase|nr:polyribonucleotide nucleotidyltransferase [Verrucomicrobiae bacterium]